MATATAVSVQEYLRTTYRPDRDFLDGEVVERNLGEKPHSRLQGFFYSLFRSHEADWGVEALTEQRVQVGSTRYRIPDVTILSIPSADERIVRTPPLLCIEVLSSEDRMSRIRERVHDYARMGVSTTWVVDPWRREAYASELEGMLLSVQEKLVLEGTPIEIGVEALWAKLDRLQSRDIPA